MFCVLELDLTIILHAHYRMAKTLKWTIVNYKIVAI